MNLALDILGADLKSGFKKKKVLKRVDLASFKQIDYVKSLARKTKTDCYTGNRMSKKQAGVLISQLEKELKRQDANHVKQSRVKPLQESPGIFGKSKNALKVVLRKRGLNNAK